MDLCRVSGAPGYDGERPRFFQMYRPRYAVFVQDKIEAARQKIDDLVAIRVDLPCVPVPVEPERRDEKFPGKVSEAAVEIFPEGFGDGDGRGSAETIENPKVDSMWGRPDDSEDATGSLPFRILPFPGCVSSGSRAGRRSCSTTLHILTRSRVEESFGAVREPERAAPPGYRCRDRKKAVRIRGQGWGSVPFSPREGPSLHRTVGSKLDERSVAVHVLFSLFRMETTWTSGRNGSWHGRRKTLGSRKGPAIFRVMIAFCTASSSGRNPRIGPPSDQRTGHVPFCIAGEIPDGDRCTGSA